MNGSTVCADLESISGTLKVLDLEVSRAARLPRFQPNAEDLVGGQILVFVFFTDLCVIEFYIPF